MRWALTRNSPHSDPENWLGNGSTSDMLALITDNDNKFKHALDRYKYPNRYPQESNGDPKTFSMTQRCEAARWLAELESHLNQGWLCGPQASLADMATLPFVRQFAHIDTAYFVTQPWPKLQAWLARFEASTLFDSVMGKHAAHKTASLHYY
jgi:glutathione S-transferase